MAATGALALVAATRKPGGADATRSPWLAQTSSDAGNPSNTAPRGSAGATVAGPYSR